MTGEQLNADITTYHNMVYRLAFGCMGNHFDADDVTQDVFIRLYRYKKAFTDDTHKKAFLIRVTVNICKDIRKSAWFRSRAEMDDNIPAAESISEDESQLCEYIRSLKPNYRAVVFLHYYDGYTTAEIAKILRIPESTVTTRLSRARTNLKTQLISNKEVYCS
ncbi:MAG: RNA polymerase sigma factor [Oscillospiraceae bacterium]|jgi:RNA polymerase sigma-70 factor (ECF subfamily)|nr:RNA polymerase sigma factor [Oscillospiraceae bacterium]